MKHTDGFCGFVVCPERLMKYFTIILQNKMENNIVSMVAVFCIYNWQLGQYIVSYAVMIVALEETCFARGKMMDQETFLEDESVMRYYEEIMPDYYMMISEDISEMRDYVTN